MAFKGYVFKVTSDGLSKLPKKKKKKRTKKEIWKNGKPSKYMRNPSTEVSTATYYPSRTISKNIR